MAEDTASSSSSSSAAAVTETMEQASKRQKAAHKPPPDALQHKFKPFVQAAYDMVSNQANWAAVRFNKDGTAVEIVDVSLFSDKVLPRYFKHKNISSFIRQMNMYGFEKIDGCEDAIHTFKHECFQKDQPALLAKILRKPVKAHRRGGGAGNPSQNEDDDALVPDIVETKRAEAHQAVDELTRLKQAQSLHEDRIRILEEENQHLTEENQRIKGAIVQVKGAQAAMTDRLRRLFMYFMRYYVRDEKVLEDTIRGLIDNAASGNDSTSFAPDPQRQVMSSLFQLKDETNEFEALKSEDELSKNHSLASPWDNQPILLPNKPLLDDHPNLDYQSFSRDFGNHIDQNDITLQRINSLTSELQAVNSLSDDLLDDQTLDETDRKSVV